MNIGINKKTYKKIALVLSLCVIIIWGILGAGTSIAWFSDTSEKVENIFHFADLELTVSHRLDNGNWETIDGKTDIFDDEAIYEPGYVQTVYLKVENTGTRALEFKTAISVIDYTLATNVFGQHFDLQDYLKFGVFAADSETEMDNGIKNREMAEAIATERLSDYYSDSALIKPGETSYMAVVVRMPEEVGNIANFRLDTIPSVDLGIIVTATQTINN